MQKYAFIDRDGTIIWEPERDKDGVARSLRGVGEVKFLPGGLDSLKLLVNRDYKLVLVTNQDYLGTASNPRSVFDEVMEYIFTKLKEQDIVFEYLMICPHGPNDDCKCRKPKAGGLNDFFAQREGKVDFANSIMIGDRDTDKEFADNIGVEFVYLNTNEQLVLS